MTDMGARLRSIRPAAVLLAAIIVAAAVLRLNHLGATGYGNTYYAATVRSMLDSWHNFFFASFEPGGSVSVDKPPLGFWVQCAFAAVLGVSGFALALPQALAGILSVPLAFCVVRRTFGETAALGTALVVAIAPVSIAADRNNTVDGLLIPLLIGAAWAALRAAETGRLRWLLSSALLIALGFNIKMLQAYLPLPACFGVYLLMARTSWTRRIVHLVVAAGVVITVSLAWPLAVDRTPPDRRPFVGSSRDNTVMELIMGHNGLQRLGELSSVLQPSQAGVPGNNDEIGRPGPFRLLVEPLGGQVSWFVPLAVFGLVAALAATPRRALSDRHRALFLWGSWLLTELAFFSVAQLFHRYYLQMLVPPIAALAGIGATALWETYARPGLAGWLLPPALLSTAAQHALILAGYPAERAGLLPVALVVTALACGLATLRLWRSARRQSLRAYAGPLVALSLLATCIAPLAWSVITVTHEAGRAMLPSAGPQEQVNPPRPPPGNDRLIDYLLAHTAGIEYLVAAVSSNEAAHFILTTNRPVLALGGFSGGDRIFSIRDLDVMIAAGRLRYFFFTADRMQGPQRDNVTWVQQRCALVPAGEWAGAPAVEAALYRCDR